MINVFLLLGSNLGDRFLLLEQAITAIENRVGEIVKRSSVYETAAWGKQEEPDYLNQVIEVSTQLSARELLDQLLNIEQTMGRERKELWASRTIDIDILFYGDSIFDEPGLVIPHPRLHLRRFTLEPLAEIAPLLVHPNLKKNILGLKNELQDTLVVKKL